jgi:hypothetical protein
MKCMLKTSVAVPVLPKQRREGAAASVYSAHVRGVTGCSFGQALGNESVGNRVLAERLAQNRKMHRLVA